MEVMENGKKKKILIALIVIVILIAGVIFWKRKNQQKTASTPAQTINLSASSEISSLDISKIDDRNSFNQVDNVDEGLFRYDKNGVPHKALATKVKISKDQTVYTIDIRHDAKWSNGDPVTAEDFVYSWQRAVDPKTASPYTYLFSDIKNADEINQGEKAVSQLGVKASGKYQLKIQLNKPQSYFKMVLARETLYPLDKKVVKKYGKAYGTSSKKTVYNGPFINTGWTGTNDSWKLKKNPYYWDKKVVKLQTINFQVIKQPSTAYNLYQTGKLDLMPVVGEQAKQLENNQDLVKRPLAATEYLQYNMSKVKALGNKNIRLGISLAINRSQLVKTILKNGSTPADGLVPAGMSKNPKTGEDFAKEAAVKNTANYDPKLAKQLFAKGLKEEGLKNLQVTLLAANDDTTKQIAEYLQSVLSKNLPQLKLSVSTIPFTVMISDVDNKKYDLNLIGWSADFADPITFLQLFTSNSSENSSGWSNAEYDQAINDSNNKDANNQQARWNDLVKAAKVLASDQGITTLYKSNSEDLVKPHLKGVVFNGINGHYSYRTAYVK